MRNSAVLTFISLCSSFVSGFSRQSRGTLRTSLRDGRQQPVPSAATTAFSRMSPLNKRTNQLFLRPIHTRGGSSDPPSSAVDAVNNPSMGGTTTECPVTGPLSVVASLWGVAGVLYSLSKAVTRVLPIALEPFPALASKFSASAAGATPVPALTPFQLGAYIMTCLFFAYAEGYKGFQKKLSPMVVKRSFTLVPGKNGTRWYHFILAPWYSMGLMHATSKRKRVSWTLSIGIAFVVAAVKRMPYPWRNILDAGVVVGLTWGAVSMLFYYIYSWITGEPPRNVDPALPESIAGPPS